MKTRFNKFESAVEASKCGQSFPAHFVGLLALRQQLPGNRGAARRCDGFTPEELLVSMAIPTILIGGVAIGHAGTTKRAGMSTYTAFVQSAALQQIEQTRAAIWDPLAWLANDERVSAIFPVATVKPEFLGASGAGAQVADRTPIKSLSVNTPCPHAAVSTAWQHPHNDYSSCLDA